MVSLVLLEKFPNVEIWSALTVVKFLTDSSKVSSFHYLYMYIIIISCAKFEIILLKTYWERNCFHSKRITESHKFIKPQLTIQFCPIE